MRAQTGAMKFGNDWPGLFIRGDDCMGLKTVISAYLNDPGNPMFKAQVYEMIELLNEPLISNDSPQLMKDATDCSAETLQSIVDSWRPEPSGDGYYWMKTEVNTTVIIEIKNGVILTMGNQYNIKYSKENGWKFKKIHMPQ